MKIFKVGWGYTQNAGNYENCKAYCEAEVEKGESPEEAYRKLKEWVGGKLPDPDEVRDNYHELLHLEEQKHQAVTIRTEALDAIERLATVWNLAKSLLESHGIKIEEEFPKIPELEGGLEGGDDDTEPGDDILD